MENFYKNKNIHKHFLNNINHNQKNFFEKYKQFLNTCKTERECVLYFENLCKEHNIKNIDNLPKNINIQPFDKFYRINKNKSIMFFCFGENAFETNLVDKSSNDNDHFNNKNKSKLNISNQGNYLTNLLSSKNKDDEIHINNTVYNNYKNINQIKLNNTTHPANNFFETIANPQTDTQTHTQTHNKILRKNINSATNISLNILLAHIDTVRLDAKLNPLKNNADFLYFDTRYTGSLIPYQYTNTPLALHGFIYNKNNTPQNIKIGEQENQPCFIITDLPPHFNNEKNSNHINGETLDVLVGSFKVNKQEILKQLNTTYENLICSDLCFVPKTKAQDVCFDKSLIGGYGQDDRSCAFASFFAFINSKPQNCTVCYLLDKEETGNVGNTSIHSLFFEDTIYKILSLFTTPTRKMFIQIMNNSNAISCDVTGSFDPNYPTNFNSDTEAHIYQGVAINKYSSNSGKSVCNDTNAEYVFKIKNLLENNKIYYQFTEMGKVDKSRGFTLANPFSEFNTNIIDAGVPILSMHSPFEIIDKFSFYQTHLAYTSFLNSTF